MFLLYNIALMLVFIAFIPYFLYKMLTTHKYKEGILCRLGYFSRDDEKEFAEKPSIWIHAVSVGELFAAGALIENISEEYPDHNVVVSTTTKTGQDEAKKKYSGRQRIKPIYFPLDFPWSVKKHLRVIRPRIILILETEIWPNFLKAASSLDIPVLLVSGCISPKSFKRYKKIRFLTNKVLPLFREIHMQSEQDKARIVQMGAPASLVRITGNIKFDYMPSLSIESASQKYRHMLRLREDHSVIIAGSTHKGEEEIILDAFEKLRDKYQGHNLVLILAPRHPERFAQVDNMLKRACSKDRYRKLSQNDSVVSDGSASVYLIDTLGILSTLYSIGHIVIMGGTFSPIGGHNILEPAAYSKPIICGPHMEEFREILDEFLKNNAVIHLKSAGELFSALTQLLENPHKRESLGQNALNVLKDNQGSTRKLREAVRHII